MKNVIVTRTVRLALTADQWALYDLPGRDDAAADLNKMAEAALNSATTPGDAAQLIAFAQDKYSSFGAADTEGYTVMNDLIDVAFPQGEVR